jgi:competence protein ComEC
VRLSWYRAPVEPAPGERWRLAVRLKSPRGFMNPGGFDYEALLFREAIGATGYVRAVQSTRRLAAAGGARPVLETRARIARELARVIGERPALGIVSGLCVGARERITREQWGVFGATGTTHLMAISGLHVGLVAALVFFGVRRLWRLAPGCGRRIAAADAAAAASLAAALAYALLAGFTVPTRRALIMLGVVLGLLLLRRAPRPAHHLCVALLAVLVFDPLASMAPGFWLSFAAVGVILLGLSGMPPASGAGRLAQYARIQWVVSLGLAPLTLWLFGRAPTVAPFVNLLLIPLFSIVVIPMALAGVALLWLVPPLGSLLLHLAAFVIERAWPAVEWAAALGGSFGGQPGFAALALAVPGILWLVGQRLPGRAIALLLLLPLVLARPAAPAPGDFRLTLLDVGQGLAAVVRTHRHALVYDAGPSFASGSDTGTLVVLPYLASQGIADLAVLMVSHEDNDHAGGARSVLERFPRARLVAGPRAAAVAGRHATPCQAGMRWWWDGVAFEILHPPAGPGHAGNDASCVLRVAAAGGSVLLPGDIERAAENRLAATGTIDADVVIVPHHGSATSSTAAFVSAVRARHAHVPAGYRNRWGFPRPDVAARWRQAGAVLLTSAGSGAITQEISARHGVSAPLQHRKDARRFWTAREQPPAD